MRLSSILLLILLSFILQEVFAQSWCRKADFPGSIRRNTEGFSINGKGYVCLGGISPTSSTHFKNLEMYDPSTDTWTSKAGFPGTARRNGIVFTIDSFAFVGMGWNNSKNFSDIYRYNANTDIWDTITPYPGLGNRNPIAVSLNGKGYMGGGTNSTSNPHQKDFYEYDPVLDQWTQLADLTFGRRSSAITFASDSLIYFGLGYNGNSVYKDLWSYQPSTSTWTQLSSFPGNNRSEASYFKIDSHTVIVGGGTGLSSSAPYPDYYEYDIKNDKWTKIIGFTAGARSRGAYFSIGNKGYISTGRSASANLKDTWEYTPKNHTFLFSDSLLCKGDSIRFDASTPGATYLWHDNSTNSTFLAKDSGTFWVEIDVNGCIRRDSINLKTIPPIKRTLLNDTSICPNDSLRFDATFQGATYKWQDNTTDSTFLANDSGTYWVEINFNGCVKRDSIKLSYKPEINFNLGLDTLLCSGDSILFDVTTIGASYLWQDNSTNANFYAKDSGLYWVDITFNECVKRDSIKISYKPKIMVDLGIDTTICSTDSLFLDATTPNASYLWQDGSNNPTFKVKSNGIYWAEVSNGKCSTRDTISILTLTNNFKGLGSDTSLCFGEIVTLSSMLPNVLYEWQDGSNNSSLTVTNSGTYWLEVSLPKCKIRDSIEVTIEPKIQVDLGKDTLLCFGNLLKLDATQTGASYLWNDGTSNSNLTIVSAGIYWVEVTINNCSRRDSIEVTYTNKVDLNLGNDTTLCLTETLTLDAFIPSSSYLWRDGSTNFNFTVSDSGSFWVAVKTNCTTLNDTIQIAYKDCNCTLKIPNVITPNKDGVNDYFFATSPCNFTNYTLTIFNRWGDKLTQLNSQFHRWDGTVNGINVDEGVYFYTIVYTLEYESKKQSKSGSFTILR